MKNKKLKEIKLNKYFVYFLSIVGVFISVKALEGISSSATGAVIGVPSAEVTLISLVSFLVGAFLTIFAVRQIAKHHKVE